MRRAVTAVHIRHDAPDLFLRKARFHKTAQAFDGHFAFIEPGIVQSRTQLQHEAMTTATGKRIVYFKFVDVVRQRIVRVGRQTDSRSLFRYRHRFLRDMHHFGHLFIKSIRIIAGKATPVGILAGNIHYYAGKVFLNHCPYLFECLQMMFLIAVHQHEEFVSRMGRTDMSGFHIPK